MKMRYNKATQMLDIVSSTRSEIHQLKIHMTRFIEGYRYLPEFKRGSFDGKFGALTGTSTPFSMLNECRQAMKAIGAPFELENKDEYPYNRTIKLEHVQEFADEFFKDTKIFNTKTKELVKIIPYDYQIEAAYKLLKNKFCCGSIATSGGKTLICSLIIFYTLKHIDPNAKFLFITPSISLVTQTFDNIIQYNKGDGNTNLNPIKLNIEELMSDKPRKNIDDPSKPINLVIGCYQTLEKYDKKYISQFYGIIIDECHISKSESVSKILRKSIHSAQLRIGVSGTLPKETSAETLIIQTVIGPKVVSILAHELMVQGTVTPVNIKICILNHNDKEFNTALNSINSMEAGKQKYDIERQYIQSSQKRTAFISKFISKCTNNTMLLFNSIEYGQALLNQLSIDNPQHEYYYIDGEVKGKEREIIKKKMEEPSNIVKILIASFGTVGTGFSLNNLFNVGLTESFRSEVRILQGIGRCLRLADNKKIATIYDFVDIYTSDTQQIKNIFYKHYKARKEMYIEHKYPHETKQFNL